MAPRYCSTNRESHHRIFALAALFCVAAVAGCGPEPQANFGSAGSAPVSLQITMPPNVTAAAMPPKGFWARVQRWVWGSDAWAASVNEITGLVVRVTGPGIPAPISSPRVPVSGAVSGLVIPVTLEVPVGADRVFAVAAVDVANRPIFQGQSEPVTLVADQPSTVSIQLTDTTIRIITSTLPDGTEDRSYTASLVAERGTGLTWTVQEGVLPPGVRLDAATGALLGTSTTAGVFPVTVRVTDAVGLFDEAPVTIRINPAPLPPRITTTTLPNGTLGAPYTTTLVATGGTGAPTWRVVAGALPDGLSLSATGVITGRPTREGTATFTVRATDTIPLSDEQVLTIRINPAPVPPAITTTTLPDGTEQVTYNARVTATGGTGAVTWRVVTGKLPDNVFLNQTTGAITGIPTKNGTFGFTVRATDTMPLSNEKALTITIKDAPRPPVITSTTLPGGQVGDTYTATLTATSTNGAVTWRLIPAGNPAPGLRLAGATITGTPSTKGTFEFTVRATDPSGLFDEQPLFILINDKPTPPFITTTTVPGGTVNVAYRAQLTATGGTGAVTWSVIPAGAPAPGLRLVGATITGTPTTPGTFSFTVRATDTTPLSDEQVLTITIQSPIRPPEITTESLPEGRVGDVYSATLTATSTNGEVRWSASGLPDRLSVDERTGAITGTPTVVGTFDVTVRATDQRNRFDEQALSLQIRGTPPVISTKSLPDGRLEFDDGESGGLIGAPYNETLKAEGGTGAITWSVSIGSLPSGLELNNSTGVITGAPSEEGRSNFTIRATDSTGLFDSKPFSIRIVRPLIITTTKLPNGAVGVPYPCPSNAQFCLPGFPIQALGGAFPYTWSLAVGQSPLPDALLLRSDGFIIGTPNVQCSYTRTYRVQDSNGDSAEAELTIFIPPCIN